MKDFKEVFKDVGLVFVAVFLFIAGYTVVVVLLSFLTIYGIAIVHSIQSLF